MHAEMCIESQILWSVLFYSFTIIESLIDDACKYAAVCPGALWPARESRMHLNNDFIYDINFSAAFSHVHQSFKLNQSGFQRVMKLNNRAMMCCSCVHAVSSYGQWVGASGVWRHGQTCCTLLSLALYTAQWYVSWILWYVSILLWSWAGWHNVRESGNLNSLIAKTPNILCFVALF